MKNIKAILAKVYDNSELRKTSIPLFMGNPGVAKTTQIEEFAKERNAHLVTLITSQLSPMEVSGLIMPNKNARTIEYYDSELLLSLKDNSILFLDEVLNGSPLVLSAMLTLLTSRVMISGKPLPNIMIVAAANPQGAVPLSPQIKERFIYYDVKFDSFMWTEYMKEKYMITNNIANKLCNLIKNETFSSHNFHTPRSIDKAVSMIILECPTPYEATIKPILTEMLPNPLTEAVDLGEGKLLEPTEMISWLNLIKLQRKQAESNKEVLC